MRSEQALPPLAAGERLLDDSIAAARVMAGTDAPPPARARVVVVGGGMIGASVAYHLARLGVTDCVLVERDRISSGTTWHPAGLLANVRTSHSLTGVARNSIAVYERLERESGIPNGFNRRGSLALARTPERLTELRYSAAIARHHGIDHELLAPGEVAERHPLVDPAGLAGGLLFPVDGTVNPGASALGLVKVAHEAGIAVREGLSVQGIDVRDGRVHAVRTDRGTIECEAAVLCTGLWTRELGRALGIGVALHAAEHVWMSTEPVDAPVWELPFVRDLDGHIYVRGYRDRLLVGAFEPNGKPRAPQSIPPGFAFGEFEPDLPHVAEPLERARERMPVLRRLEIERHLNAPESFTPDNLPLVGEAPEVGGLLIAAGMNSQGILLGPGTGQAVAEWIVAGGPTQDLGELAPGRFSDAQTTGGYLFERTRESLGRLYAMHWPQLQPATARGLRRTPLHHRLAAAGACFGEAAGWERANWYGEPGTRPEYAYSFERPPWFDRVAAEHRAAREAVALFDLSSFAKFEVAGGGALRAMQRVLAGDLDVPVGKVVYTTMLNERGGIEIDLTATRLAEDAFLLVAPAITQRRVGHWLARHAAGGDVTVTDVTSAFGTLAVMGPRSRELLARLTDADLSSAAFPHASAQRIDLGWAHALAVRVSFVGELGWELYPATESVETVYDLVLEAGADLGLRHAGYHALDSLRMEKGYRHWPLDIGPADTPLDGGLGFTVAWEKPDFIGRAALLEAREAPRRRRLVHLLLDDPEPLLHHGESVLREGRVVGRIMSGAYAHHLGRAAAIAVLEDPAILDPSALSAGGFSVDVLGAAIPATVSARPFYDPSNDRLRA
jgi:glycine cleavage system aminomethyltransferase T/glycine/D-amino acid oxidase-like deaminating enzyme